MIVIQQTEWYQEFRKTEAERYITLVLEHRFGSVPPQFSEALQQRSADELEQLLLAAADAESLAAFEAQLDR